MRTRTERRADRERHEITRDLAERWRWVLQGTSASRTVTNGAGAPVASTPTVTGVQLAGPLGAIVLTVRLLAGQLPADLMAVAARIAEGMGVAAVRVRSWRPGYVQVHLLAADPLAETVALDLDGPLDPDGVLVGVLEHGGALRVPPAELPHLMVQGETGSGKSTLLYGLLAQLARYPAVRIAGVDPSGITLRPFASTHHAGWQVLGLGDLAAVERQLVELVADMDARLAAMPADRDVLPVTEAHPVTVVVLEEYPALLRALDAADPKQGKRVRALVARLLAESRKVGLRVVLVAQRAEATIVGGAERAQCGGRLSFRVDGLDSLKLMHADGDGGLAAEHTSAPPGIALCSWPGAPLQRLRAPVLGEYRDYVNAVRNRSEHVA